MFLSADGPASRGRVSGAQFIPAHVGKWSLAGHRTALQSGHALQRFRSLKQPAKHFVGHLLGEVQGQLLPRQVVRVRIGTIAGAPRRTSGYAPSR